MTGTSRTTLGRTGVVRLRRAGLAAALALLVLAPGATALTFKQAGGSPVLLTSAAPGGQGNAGLVMGDFNGDGKLDLAASWAGSGPGGAGSYVSVLMGNGAGGITPGSGSPILITSGGGAPAGALAVGRFNTDQKLDLAVISATGSATVPGHVAILLGNGDGSFTPAGPATAVGKNPSSIVAGDFNSDQSEDLAVTNRGSGSVSILLGDGTGGFTAAPSSPLKNLGNCPQGTAAGDFNGDHRVDLAVGTGNCGGYGGSGDLYVLLGDGSGGFSTAPRSPLDVGSDVTSIASADFNGDGRADLAVAPGGGGAVRVLLGDGKGGFAATSGSTTAGYSPRALAIGDFNADGHPDLAVVGDTQDPRYATNGVAEVLTGDGGGKLTPVPDSPFIVGEQLNSSPRQVVVGDFNGDHRRDMAVLTIGCQCQGPDVTAHWGPSVSVLLNRPGNSSVPSATLRVTPNPALTKSPVTLDASSSYGGSPNDPVVDYKWDLGSGRFSMDTGASPQTFTSFSRTRTVSVRVRVTNATGAVDTAVAQVDVRPSPPPGTVGISIDNGAYATNTTSVKLHLIWPVYATQAVISNDSMFDAAGSTETVAVVPTISWTLPTAHSDHVPQIVYVRFPDSSLPSQTFRDGIVLDTTVPVIQKATLLAHHAASDLGATAGRKQSFRVRISATEKISGISTVQLSTGRSPQSGTTTVILVNRHRRGIRQLAQVVSARMAKAPVGVRVRSAASTWSTWHRIN